MATNKEKLQIIVDAQGIKKTRQQLKSLEKATGLSTKSFAGMASGILGVTTVLYAFGKAAQFTVKVGKEFEQAMANVKAISNATNKEFKDLEQNAKLLGRSTKFTATEVANLQTEYAKLGFTASEINNVTKGTLDLASAVGSDLATSASVAGSTLRGFAMDTSETTRVTDIMAKSFSASALDMDKFSNSMTYVAPVAKLAGFEIEGTTAMLGQLANAGISGSMAGTSLRRIFLELSNESSKLSKRLGGSIKSVDELVPALEKLKLEGISTAEMKDLVGQRAISAFSVLIDGASDVDKLAESFRNAGGSAQRMAEIQLDTLQGRMTIAKSASEGLAIALMERMTPGLKNAVDGFTNLISSTTRWVEIKGSEKLIEEQFHLNTLVDTLIKYNDDADTRNHVINELQKLYPEFIENIDLETASVEDLVEALKEGNDQYDERVRRLAQQETIAENIRLQTDLTKQIQQTRIELEGLKNKEEELADDQSLALSLGYQSSAFQQNSTDIAMSEHRLEMLQSQLEQTKKELIEYTNATKIANDQPLVLNPDFEQFTGPYALPEAPSIEPGESAKVGPTDADIERAKDKIDKFNEQYEYKDEQSAIARLKIKRDALIDSAKLAKAGNDTILKIEQFYNKKIDDINKKAADKKREELTKEFNKQQEIIDGYYTEVENLGKSSAQVQLDNDVEAYRQARAKRKGNIQDHKSDLEMHERTLEMFAQRQKEIDENVASEQRKHFESMSTDLQEFILETERLLNDFDAHKQISFDFGSGPGMDFKLPDISGLMSEVGSIFSGFNKDAVPAVMSLDPDVDSYKSATSEINEVASEFYKDQAKLHMDSWELKQQAINEEELAAVQQIRNMDENFVSMEEKEKAYNEALAKFDTERAELTIQKEQEKLKHLSQFDEQAKMKYLDVQKEAAIKEAEALGAQKEELLRIEQEFADRKKEIQKDSSDFTINDILNVTSQTLSIFGDSFGSMAKIKKRDLDIEKKRLKEYGYSNEQIQQMTKESADELQQTRYRQAQFAAFEAAINAYNSLAAIPIVGVGLGIAAGAAALKFGLDQAEQIKKAEKGGYLVGPSHSQGGVPIEAEGGEFIINKRSVNKVGVPFLNAINQDSIVPLETPDQEQEQPLNITVNVTAPLVDDTVVDTIIPAIREAVRRGEDIGVS